MKFKIWTRELEFNQETKIITYKNQIFTPNVRTYWDMKDMYKYKNDLKDNEWLYYMYRDVYFDDNDLNILRENKIRFDITIILPQLFWDEYNKTYWHYHPLNSNKKSFQELYQVLSWNAIYLLQNDKKVSYTEAKWWDAVNMWESFWHITINPSETEVLVMANIVDDTFESIYNDYKTKNGWMYYYSKKWWYKNPNFDIVPEIEEDKTKFDITTSIYDDFIKNPEKFNYLH